MAATTMRLIAKASLGSTASSVSIQDIPATYSDLYIFFSGRSDYSGATNGGVTDAVVRVNNDSGNNYSYRVLYGTNTTVGSFSGSSVSSLHFGNVPTANSTASTFCSHEIYIPNYAGSTNKSLSLTTARETNAAAGDIRAIAGLWSSTSAITRVDVIADYPGGSFVSGTSIYVYGITKA